MATPRPRRNEARTCQVNIVSAHAASRRGQPLGQAPGRPGHVLGSSLGAAAAVLARGVAAMRAVACPAMGAAGAAGGAAHHPPAGRGRAAVCPSRRGGERDRWYVVELPPRVGLSADPSAWSEPSRWPTPPWPSGAAAATRPTRLRRSPPFSCAGTISGPCASGWAGHGRDSGRTAWPRQGVRGKREEELACRRWVRGSSSRPTSPSTTGRLGTSRPIGAFRIAPSERGPKSGPRRCPRR